MKVRVLSAITLFDLLVPADTLAEIPDALAQDLAAHGIVDPSAEAVAYCDAHEYPTLLVVDPAGPPPPVEPPPVEKHKTKR